MVILLAMQMERGQDPAYRATLLIKFLEINDLSKVLFDGDIQG
jgi:hypothetical protein